MTAEQARNLRDIVNEGTGLEGLSALLTTDFEFDKDDVPFVYSLGVKQREVSPKLLDKLSEDYSVESRIFLSYCYRQLKKAGVPKDVLQKFTGIIDLWESYYVNPQSKKTGEIANIAHHELYEFLLEGQKNAANGVLSNCIDHFSQAEEDFWLKEVSYPRDASHYYRGPIAIVQSSLGFAKLGVANLF